MAKNRPCFPFQNTYVQTNWDFGYEKMSSGNPALQGNREVFSAFVRDFRKQYNSGLPDFYWYNIPKREQIYQIIIKYTKWP
jgi:hypothetical protein